ncbi:MAG TPA: ribonuclease Z [Clostridium sp.]|uniref:Ribonuclease Z n=2 Tax=root TaxID=1 RepID=A0A120MKC4_ANAPI|nr:ribonuclease Z [Anaerotignum propionicum]AMJ41843.1 ribonuclease BN [Anaerotignum propionicum DSM 1682]MEA5058340.1 ribonuclease Z [Anaerotignum propionicum]SHF04685.1 ribonuclease Z [[Clostridium] propionicum DSM 1682] [Anaerotignum propionicum DSM 1682]HBF66099.1 ribonuclease Z [Clostridium sp.]
MLDICLLGTGGMMPMPGRFLTAMLARINGRLLLIDCGEGTQVTMKMQGWGFKSIDVICITHFHADHISGLPGLLLTIGNAGRTEPLTIIGPQGLAYIVEGLCRICPELPFPLTYIEIGKDTPNPIQVGNFMISHCLADHMVKCYAYRVDLQRRGKFDVKKAEGLGIPKTLWGSLQKEGFLEFEGKTYTSDMVLGNPRAGIGVAYCTDSRPVDRLRNFIRGVQLFICEGMYGEDEKIHKAKENKHMLFSEAAQLAKDGEAEALWLTHFSPSLNEPELFLEVAQNIFPNTVLGVERMSTTILFPKDDLEDKKHEK